MTIKRQDRFEQRMAQLRKQDKFRKPQPKAHFEPKQKAFVPNPDAIPFDLIPEHTLRELRSSLDHHLSKKRAPVAPTYRAEDHDGGEFRAMVDKYLVIVQNTDADSLGLLTEDLHELLLFAKEKLNG